VPSPLKIYENCSSSDSLRRIPTTESEVGFGILCVPLPCLHPHHSVAFSGSGRPVSRQDHTDGPMGGTVRRSRSRRRGSRALISQRLPVPYGQPLGLWSQDPLAQHRLVASDNPVPNPLGPLGLRVWQFLSVPGPVYLSLPGWFP
jgi:hypothetical protein